MLAVSVYDHPERIAALGDTWGQLWRMTPEASWTGTPEFLTAAARDGAGEPRVFVATAAGRLVGLWPMLLRRTAGPLGRRLLTGGGDTEPLFGPVGPHPTATAAVVARHLAAAGGWDELRLAEPVPRGGAGRYAAAFASAGLAVRTGAAAPLAEICLNGRWADVIARCDTETRFAIYRAAHDAGRGGDGYALHRVRPINRSGLGTLPVELAGMVTSGTLWGTVRGAELTATAADAATLDMAVLRHAGRPAAAAVGYVTADGYECRGGMVAAGAPADAGPRLAAELLRDGLTRGDRRCLFTAGPGHPLAGWASGVRERQAVRVIAPGRPAARLHRIGSAMRRLWREPAEA